MIAFKSSLIYLSAFGIAGSSAAAPSLMPHRSNTKSNVVNLQNHKTLAVRGGAGPLDVEATAKYASAAFLTHALYQKLAPSKTTEGYGLDVDDRVIFVEDQNADLNLSLGIISTLLFWKAPSTTERAVGAGLLVGILSKLKHVLNDVPAGGNAKIKKFAPAMLLLDLVVFHACMTGAEYADTALKVYAAYCLFNGLYLVLFPDAEAWDEEGTATTASHRVMNSVVGQNVAAVGVLVGALALGVEATTAYGYALGTVLLGVTHGLVGSKVFGDADMKKGPLYTWIAMLLAAVVTLAVPKAAVEAAATS